jgi:hypothetical protein
MSPAGLGDAANPEKWARHGRRKSWNGLKCGVDRFLVGPYQFSKPRKTKRRSVALDVAGPALAGLQLLIG